MLKILSVAVLPSGAIGGIAWESRKEKISFKALVLKGLIEQRLWGLWVLWWGRDPTIFWRI